MTASARPSARSRSTKAWARSSTRPALAIARLLAFAWPLKGMLALSLLLGLATIICGVGLMSTSAYLISAAALHPSVAALGVAIVGVRFFGIARAVFRYLERYVSHYVALGISARLRVWFYSAVEPLAPARLIRYKGGDLLSRAIADIETVQDFYVRAVYPPLVAALVAVVLWVLLGAFDPMFAMLFMLFYVASGVGVPALAHMLGRGLGSEVVRVRADLSAHLADGIKGVADMIAFGQEERETERIGYLNGLLVSLQKRLAWVSGLEAALGSLLLNIAMWSMLVLAIPLVRDGKLDGVYLAVLVLATMAGFEAVVPLPAAARNLGASTEAARRLFELADTIAPVADPQESSPVPPRYDIAFRNVSFGYGRGSESEDSDDSVDNGSLALDSVSFCIPQGSCLALIGPSGAGKTTAANLLLRFWEWDKGEILLGGRDLRHYAAEDVRRVMGVVAQNTYLFNTTIRENLLIARQGASDDEISSAVTRAQLDTLVQSLPEGLDTRVGEDGVKLSGGERQRVAIARAFLKDAPILILDEPTASLDAPTELAIFAVLRNLARERTTLLITHRHVGLGIADKVVVLHDGRVEGTRDVAPDGVSTGSRQT